MGHIWKESLMRCLAIPAAAALVLGSMAVTEASGLSLSAAHSSPSPSSRTRTVDCGRGFNDLSLQVVTAHAGKSTCATAKQVSDAFGKAVRGGKQPPVTVSVRGASWKCEEKQPTNTPNPYTECASSKQAEERVLLVS
ncbi:MULTISPECIES: hypothetical protein [unclassified Streptomyces]|uniref:hypothetical protein n=1 Tax=unclassified Streptomyces TaxID=2593676 RepID=UPI004042D962